MKTLQEYLNSKYLTTSEKEAVIQISTVEIQEEREKQGLTDDLLEGGELDLREYLNIQEVIIDQQFLTTPLTKIETDGLIHLKEIIWNSESPKPIDSEEDKKLWTDLGISEETKENTAKKQVIREIKKLNELFSAQQLAGKKINIHFATDKAKKEQLEDGKLGVTESGEDGEFNIYLQLERKDNQGNFCPNLIFWTFAQELTHTLIEKRFSPDFWQRFLFDENSLVKWVGDKINTDYQDFHLLTMPANFPHHLLNIKENLKISFFDANLPQETTNEQVTITSPLIDETWTVISKELISLTTQELIKGTEQEKLVQLLTLEYNQNEYTLNLVYHQENPLHEQISRLIITTPLKLEIENLKQKQNQLPTTENFDKLTKQNKELEDYLQDFTDEESYQKILAKINEIN